MTQEQLIDQFCEFRGKCTTDDVTALNFAYKMLAPRWISVEDELPKCYKPYIDYDGTERTDLLESDMCVVLLAYGNYTVATLNQDCDEETGTPTKEPYWFDEKRNDDGDCINGEVTHWMPLPKMPKKGGKD